MKNNAQRIRTSHVGRLPVPQGFEQTALRLTRGEVGGEEVAAQVVPVVADVVKRQVGIGLDCIGDGEYWSALDIKWFDQQMTGLGTRPLRPGEVGSMRESTRARRLPYPLCRYGPRRHDRLDTGRAAAPTRLRLRRRCRVHDGARRPRRARRAPGSRRHAAGPRRRPGSARPWYYEFEKRMITPSPVARRSSRSGLARRR